MADPGEACDSFSVLFVPALKMNSVDAVAARFLKYPQFPIVIMIELHLCAHDHSFVPPW